MQSRRRFIQSCISLPLLAKIPAWVEPRIMTVSGEISTDVLGNTLVHEHVLVDFIGADKITPQRWEHDAVINKILPYLLEMKAKGINSIAECTPAYLGRDVLLLRKLAKLSGLHILTNTGFYGASNDKYLPSFAHTENALELAKRWISEFSNGIDGTDIKPGFIKIGVNPGSLSHLHKKLIEAAALTHLQTGLTICSHTGPALPAHEQLEILKHHGVHPSAFVWVHANGTHEDFQKLGNIGCWISLDGIHNDNMEQNAAILLMLKANKLLGQVVISHDAGWYKPGEPNGGVIRGYTTISDQFIPLLYTKGFSKADIRQLLVENPANMLAIKVRGK